MNNLSDDARKHLARLQQFGVTAVNPKDNGLAPYRELVKANLVTEHRVAGMRRGWREFRLRKVPSDDNS